MELLTQKAFFHGFLSFEKKSSHNIFFSYNIAAAVFFSFPLVAEKMRI